MKKQKIFLSIFVTLLLMSCVAAANAITLTLPAESATMTSATQYLNASLDSNDDSIENISFYYRPVSGTGAWTLIGYKENTTDTQTTFNATWDSTSVIDNNNSEINATAMDIANDHVSTDASIKVIIDNGDPTAAWSSSTIDGIIVKYGTSFTTGITADSTIGVKNCTIFLGSGTAQEMTATANACSESYAAEDFGITANGEYDMIITVTDANADKTNTSTRTVTVATLASGGTESAMENIDEEQTEDDTTIGTTDTLPEKNFIIKIWDKIVEFFNRIFK